MPAVSHPGKQRRISPIRENICHTLPGSLASPHNAWSVQAADRAVATGDENPVPTSLDATDEDGIGIGIGDLVRHL